MIDISRLTESPVQNIGHCSHGAWRERTQVLRYGFRTINGKTGGSRVEVLTSPAATAPSKKLFNCILNRAHGTRVVAVPQKKGLRLELRPVCSVAQVMKNAQRPRQRAGSIADEPAPRRKDRKDGRRAQAKDVEDARVHKHSSLR